MTEYIIGIEGTLHEDYIEIAPKISGEIVRCRDCCCCHTVNGHELCIRFNHATSHDGFCAWGVRGKP